MTQKDALPLRLPLDGYSVLGQTTSPKDAFEPARDISPEHKAVALIHLAQENPSLYSMFKIGPVIQVLASAGLGSNSRDSAALLGQAAQQLTKPRFLIALTELQDPQNSVLKLAALFQLVERDQVLGNLDEEASRT